MDMNCYMYTEHSTSARERRRLRTSAVSDTLTAPSMQTMKGREGGRLPWMCALVVRPTTRARQKLALHTVDLWLASPQPRRALARIPCLFPHSPPCAERRSTPLDSHPEVQCSPLLVYSVHMSVQYLGET